MDERDSLPQSIEPKLEPLRNAGYSGELTSDHDLVVEAIIRKGSEATRVQWFIEEETSRHFSRPRRSSIRISAARDAVDLINIVERYAPLGPLVWAVSGKAPDMAPPSTLRSIRANVFGYAEDEVGAVRMEDGARMDWRRLRQVRNLFSTWTRQPSFAHFASMSMRPSWRVVRWSRSPRSSMSE